MEGQVAFSETTSALHINGSNTQLQGVKKAALIQDYNAVKG